MRAFARGVDAALGPGEAVVVVADGADAQERDLGRAITRDDAEAAELGADLAVELRGLGRGAGHRGLEPREERALRIAALGFEIAQDERCSARRDRAAELAQARGGSVVELLDQDRARAAHQADHQHGDAADVGQRERNREAVVRVDRERGRDPARARGDRGIAVHRALGGRGRARRVQDPADVIRIEGRSRRRREDRSIRFGQRAIADEDPGRPASGSVAPARDDRLGHRRVVEAAPDRRHDEQSRSDLAEDLRELALAVDGQDRILDGTEAREGAGEDGRLDPGRELPGDAVAGADAELREARGDPRAAVAELDEADLAPALVEQEDGVRRRRRPRFDQRPEVAFLDHADIAFEKLARPRSRTAMPSWFTTRKIASRRRAERGPRPSARSRVVSVSPL